MELQILSDDVLYRPSLAQDGDDLFASTGSISAPQVAAGTTPTGAVLTKPSNFNLWLTVDERLNALWDWLKDCSGTGGIVKADDLAELGAFTGSSCISIYVGPRHVALTDSSSISDQVATIKAAFGLSISQLAEILRVQRPTIYSWLDLDRTPGTLRETNRLRLQTLYDLAQTWNRLSGEPLKDYLDSFRLDGASLLDLLSQPRINSEQIRNGMTEIKKRVDQSTRETDSVAARLRARGFAEVPAGAKRGYATRSTDTNPRRKP